MTNLLSRSGFLFDSSSFNAYGTNSVIDRYPGIHIPSGVAEMNNTVEMSTNTTGDWSKQKKSLEIGKTRLVRLKILFYPTLCVIIIRQQYMEYTKVEIHIVDRWCSIHSAHFKMKFTIFMNYGDSTNLPPF